jgi:histone H3/H4
VEAVKDEAISLLIEEIGRYSIEEFTERKRVTIQYEDRQMPC